MTKPLALPGIVMFLAATLIFGFIVASVPQRRVNSESDFAVFINLAWIFATMFVAVLFYETGARLANKKKSAKPIADSHQSKT